MTPTSDRENAPVQHTIKVTRTARYFVHGPVGRDTTDVWIALHGYAQLAPAFAATAHWPEAPHRAYVFPEALQRFYDSDYRRPGANGSISCGPASRTRMRSRR